MDELLSVVDDTGKGSKSRSAGLYGSGKRATAVSGSSKPQKRIIVTLPCVEDMDEDGNVCVCAGGGGGRAVRKRAVWNAEGLC